MIILVPLGGSGSRFKKKGYKLPKALINVSGKPIIFWLLDNLKININNGALDATLKRDFKRNLKTEL